MPINYHTLGHLLIFSTFLEVDLKCCYFHFLILRAVKTSPSGLIVKKAGNNQIFIMTLTERRGRNWLSKILLLTNLSHDCIRQLGLYKNMACGQKGNNAQFKCVAGKADCCCCWLLFTHDFVSQKFHLEDLIHVIISVIFTQNTNKMSSNSLSNTASRGCKTLLSEQLKNPILMK